MGVGWVGAPAAPASCCLPRVDVLPPSRLLDPFPVPSHRAARSSPGAGDLGRQGQSAALVRKKNGFLEHIISARDPPLDPLLSLSPLCLLLFSESLWFMPVTPWSWGCSEVPLEDAPAAVCRRRVWRLVLPVPPTHTHPRRKVSTRAEGGCFSVRAFQRPWLGETYCLEVHHCIGPFPHTSPQLPPFSSPPPPRPMFIPLCPAHSSQPGEPPGFCAGVLTLKSCCR